MVATPFFTSPMQPHSAMATMNPMYLPVASSQPQPQVKPSFSAPSIPAIGRLTSPFLGDTASGVVDTIGRQVGIGQAVNGPFTGAEPFTKGTAGGLSGSFTPANAIGGFAGNLAGNALFGGDRGIGATIGGAAGGIAGSAVLGQAVIPIPGVGAFLGSLAGNALGGLFGGKKPNPASTAGSEKGLTAQGAFIDGGKISSKHTGGEFGTQMRDSLTQFNSALHNVAGVDFSWMSNQTGYDVNHGPGFIAVNAGYVKGHETYNPDQVFTFDPKDPASQEQAFRNYGRKVLELNPSLNLSPEQMDQKVEQAMNLFRQNQMNQQGTGAFQGTLGTPMVKQQSGVGNESYADFMKRYRETGDVTPKMAKNTG